MGTVFSVLLIVLGVVCIIAGVTKNDDVLEMMRRGSRFMRSFSDDSLPTAVLVEGIIFAVLGLVTLIF